MSSNATDEPDERVTDEERDRYVGLNIRDEQFILYDREDTEAWIQSTVAVTISDQQ